MDNSRTQIVATLGPSSEDPKIIREMIENHMDVARLNFSHGDYKEHKGFIENVRKIAKELGREIPIIADLSGPRETDGGGHHFSGEEGSVITDKDRKDLEFVLGLGVEYVAMSYIGGEEDVLELRGLIEEMGGNAKIIAKIERKVAVFDIQKIVEASDAIMVARGDLGNEVPLETIPFVERDIVNAANKGGKPVIVATEMMPSMIEDDRPTRSDVTDVAYAVLANADAVMLSDETAMGKHPVEVVKMMERVVLESEKHDTDTSIRRL